MSNILEMAHLIRGFPRGCDEAVDSSQYDESEKER